MSIINCTAFDCRHHKDGKCVYNTVAPAFISTATPCVYFTNKQQENRADGFIMSNDYNKRADIKPTLM